MSKSDLTISLLVDQKPEQAFQSILQVDRWWSETIEGHAEKVGDEFTYRHKDMHYSKQKLVELVPGKKVVWLVTESHLSFITHHSEWTGTRISFELSANGSQTEVRFTHYGLTSESECLDACTEGWTYYLRNSLLQLIATGKGNPDVKESEPTKLAN